MGVPGFLDEPCDEELAVELPELWRPCSEGKVASSLEKLRVALPGDFGDEAVGLVAERWAGPKDRGGGRDEEPILDAVCARPRVCVCC